MTTLGGLLQIGRSAIVTHQAALSVVSSNTANADTVGYAKRDVQFSSLAAGGGVGIGAVLRRSSDLVAQRVLLANGRLGAHQAMSDGLGALEGKFTDREAGLGGSLDAFFAALRTLATDPADAQLRGDVLARADALTSAFSDAAATIDRERRGTDGAISVELARVNQLAAQIADANERVASTAPDTADRAEQLDRRQQLVDELGGLVQLTTLPAADGTLTLLVQGGATLVQGANAASLRGTPDAANGGLLRVDLVDVSGAALDVTDDLRGGSIGGRLMLRDETFVATADSLDQLAYDLATSFNAVHGAGFGTDGVSGRDLFAPPAQVAGAAAGFALAPGMIDNPAWFAAADTAAGASGNNDNLLSMLALADAPLAAGGTLTAGQQVASMIGEIGRNARAETDAADEAAASLEQNQALLQSATGVSIDEELVDLTRYQRAYQAGARIISTVDTLFDTLLAL
jgi:flagellar hook-associated protein 1 FlgK